MRIVVELLALVALLGGSGCGVAWIVNTARQSRERAKRREEQAHEDLRSALASRDYRRLDDHMIMYDDLLSADVKKHIKIRRDELYVESNS